jgi:hypothetical protein
MVDRVIDAAASEPVFLSACLALKCGSGTSARSRRLCAIEVLTSKNQHKSPARLRYHLDLPALYPFFWGTRTLQAPPLLSSVPEKP